MYYNVDADNTVAGVLFLPHCFLLHASKCTDQHENTNFGGVQTVELTYSSAARKTVCVVCSQSKTSHILMSHRLPHHKLCVVESVAAGGERVSRCNTRCDLKTRLQQEQSSGRKCRRHTAQRKTIANSKTKAKQTEKKIHTSLL